MKELRGLILLALLGLGISTQAGFEGAQEQVGVITSPAAQGSTWFVVNKFGGGYQTKFDPTKISDEASPQGQNTTVNYGDRISVRDLGYDLLPSEGTLSATTSPVTSLHTFRTRSGENILMRSWGRNLEYFEERNDTWEALTTSSTDGLPFGFADFNINTDLHSKTYFGNGVDAGSSWTGDHTLLNGAANTATSTLTVDSTEGFASTGSVVYCGIPRTYVNITPTSFNLSSNAHACPDNRGVASAIATETGSPKGNIYLTANNRLFISGITSSTQAVFFSAYANASSWAESVVSDSTAASAGIFNLGEGGGGVTAAVLDENSIYFFKKSIIYSANLTDTLYTVTPLKPFDGKGQTTGAVAPKSTFTGGNAVYFVTPDRQVMGLTRVEGIDYPQNIAISDLIKPTIAAANFASSTGVVFQDHLYLSARSDDDAPVNDTVFVYNIKDGFWDTPIIGWAVSDWAVYDDGTGEKLYWGDANTANTYVVTESPNDYQFGVKANWRSKQFDFGSPQALKQVDNLFVDGYISPNTTLTISLLLDENGVTQRYQANLVGTETGFIFDAPSYNVFGFYPFGTERFGTQDDGSDMRKFRVYLNKSVVATPFYVAQVEFASDGDSQQWEVDNFGFRVRQFTQPEKPSLFRLFQ